MIGFEIEFKVFNCSNGRVNTCTLLKCKVCGEEFDEEIFDIDPCVFKRKVALEELLGYIEIVSKI